MRVFISILLGLVGTFGLSQNPITTSMLTTPAIRLQAGTRTETTQLRNVGNHVYWGGIRLDTNELDSVYVKYQGRLMGKGSGWVRGDTLFIDTSFTRIYSGSSNIVVGGSYPNYIISDIFSIGADSTAWVHSLSGVTYLRYPGDSVGIGTQTPWKLLDVDGSAHLKDTLFFGDYGDAIWSVPDLSLYTNRNWHVDSNTIYARNQIIIGNKNITDLFQAYNDRDGVIDSTFRIGSKGDVYAPSISEAASKDTILAWVPSTGEVFAIPKSSITSSEVDPIYATDSSDIKDTLTAHNTRINQRVRSVAGTSPVVSSGGYTPAISIHSDTLASWRAKMNQWKNDSANYLHRSDTVSKVATRYWSNRTFRTMSNHDSLSTLDEKSYESLTNKPVLSVNSDAPYSSVITLDSADVIVTADSGLQQTVSGNEIIFKNTKRTLTSLDEKSYNSLTDKPTSWGISAITNLQDSLNDRYRRKDTATVLLGRTRAASTYVPKTLTILSTNPLTGGGDLSTNRTLAIIADTLTVWRTKQNQWKNDSANYLHKSDTILKVSTRYWSNRTFRTMSNHDSLSALDEKSYNSLTDKPDFIDPADTVGMAKRTWVIAQDSLAKQGIRTEYVNHDTLVQQYARTRDALKVSKADSNINGSYTSKKYVDALGARIDDSLGNIYTDDQVNALLALKRNLNNHDSLSTLDEKSYNSLTDVPTYGLTHYEAAADSLSGSCNITISGAIKTNTCIVTQNGYPLKITDQWVYVASNKIKVKTRVYQYDKIQISYRY